MPLLHWRAPVGPALQVRPPQGRQARLYPVACWQRCSRAPLPFLATRAHCWLMYCPAGYPGHFLQSCFPVLKETRIQILFLKLGGLISYLVQFSNLENQVVFLLVFFNKDCSSFKVLENNLHMHFGCLCKHFLRSLLFFSPTVSAM